VRRHSVMWSGHVTVALAVCHDVVVALGAAHLTLTVDVVRDSSPAETDDGVEVSGIGTIRHNDRC